jgi:hypothetical protein
LSTAGRSRAARRRIDCLCQLLTVRRDHFSFESARAAQGICYQAGVLRPLEQLARLGNVRPRRNGQARECRKARELRHSLDAIEHPLDPTFKPQPVEVSYTSDWAEAQDKAAYKGCAQESLRRPNAPGPIEFGWRRCLKTRQLRSGEPEQTGVVRSCGDDILMRIGMHLTHPLAIWPPRAQAAFLSRQLLRLIGIAIPSVANVEPLSVDLARDGEKFAGKNCGAVRSCNFGRTRRPS